MAKKKRARKAPTQAKVVFKPEELEMIRGIAKETGRSLASFIRVTMLEAAERYKKGNK